MFVGMNKGFIYIPVLLALILFVQSSAFAKSEKYIVYYKNKQVDTVYSEIQYSEIGGQFMEADGARIDASCTDEIAYVNPDNEVVKGVSFEGNWYFKVFSGDPVSLYSLEANRYKASDLFFSSDDKKFIACTKENLKIFFTEGEETEILVEKYLRTAIAQKFFLHSNITAGPGLLIGLASPLGVGFVAYSVASTGTSLFLNKTLKKKLFKIVTSFNFYYHRERGIREEFWIRYK